MKPQPTEELTELVLHVLAHVRLAGPGNIHDPRYVAWVREHASAEHVEVLRQTAEPLAAAWRDQTPMMVHAWPELFETVEALRATAGRTLAELGPDDVAGPGILRELKRLDPAPVERLHATLQAVASDGAPGHRERARLELRHAERELRPWWEPAVAVLPSLEASRIELSHVLGARGRVYGERIVVGAPVPWNALDPRVSVLLAMHEQLVRDAGPSSYADGEWAALTGLADRMRDAPHALRRAHAQWLASLELGPLLESIHAAGRIDATTREVLERSPEHRAGRLAELGS
ncbi:MAG: hypothetical protein AB1Z98_11760 [Nannocystaceae bacterium]